MLRTAKTQKINIENKSESETWKPLNNAKEILSLITVPAIIKSELIMVEEAREAKEHFTQARP